MKGNAILAQDVYDDQAILVAQLDPAWLRDRER